MSSVQVTFHSAGFQQMLTSGPVKAFVKDLADGIADKANPPSVPSITSPAVTAPYYVVEDGTTDRARYRVAAHSRRAARHEAKTQALQKAF